MNGPGWENAFQIVDEVLETLLLFGLLALRVSLSQLSITFFDLLLQLSLILTDMR
jgi:hypothetical protein